MVYEKPEITLLGNASELIQGAKLGNPEPHGEIQVDAELDN
ncbi:MAG: hypothetical protein JWN63_571 [Candidatus Acidoferrum typicum]|nr:hypothetical protein [Candidatus Acidoferrum typicum]